MSWVAPNDTPVLPDPGGSTLAGVYLLGDLSPETKCQTCLYGRHLLSKINSYLNRL